MTRFRHFGPGLLLAALIATVATVLGRMVPVIGAPVLALAIGAVVSAVGRGTVSDTGRFGPGLVATRKRLLGAAIVLLGLGLPVGSVLTVGRETAVVLLGTLVLGAAAAVVIGRMLALERESATLVAVGTTICGASAIAAATAVLKPNRDRVAYALGTIFVFNVVAVLAYPPLGHLLGLSQEAFGLWAGTAINDTSSVLAAGVMFGPAAAHFAVIVKLVRSLMIVPMCLGLYFTKRRADSETTAKNTVLQSFPLFVVLFLVASVIAGLDILPTAAAPALAHLSAWLIAAVLAAIGTSLTWRQLRSAGARPLLFGGLLAVVLGVSSLALQLATGWW
ncbi:putative sulfate exporter family transporter [Nocardia brasiliensis]|uniref:Putative sulfate exporter family transporter n=1 Tax=Nocardia brasiliensis TaxID=37326 RepID=A0A6G9XYZ8_NOCBR|nr:putative sulfate exporter family transporter [Nocardia brasiliensis]QIS06126.1 putative sulfate exporter family transporter [Nocardia brasiliensis]